MIEDISAVKNFIDVLCYKKEGVFIGLYVEAFVNDKVVYQGVTNCSFSYNYGYSQYAISIDWNLSNEVMTNLGLHGSYNTNFQKMEFSGDSLIIESDDCRIILSRKESIRPY